MHLALAGGKAVLQKDIMGKVQMSILVTASILAKLSCVRLVALFSKAACFDSTSGSGFVRR